MGAGRVTRLSFRLGMERACCAPRTWARWPAQRSPGCRWFQTDVPAQAQSGVVAIAGGDDFSMAVREDGSVVSWGWGRVDIPDNLTGAVDVVASGQAALVLTQQGRAVHLGGDNTLTWQAWDKLFLIPADVQSGVVAVSIGVHAAAAITTTPPGVCPHPGGRCRVVNHDAKVQL